MNINECGCRPYGWLGLDGNRCIRVIPRHYPYSSINQIVRVESENPMFNMPYHGITINSFVDDAERFVAYRISLPSLQAPLECIVRLVLQYLQLEQ